MKIRERETAQMISKHGKNTNKGESGQRVYVSLYYFYFLHFFCKFEFISKKKKVYVAFRMGSSVQLVSMEPGSPTQVY